VTARAGLPAQGSLPDRGLLGPALGVGPLSRSGAGVQAAFGHSLAPLGNCLGLGWRLRTALMTSFVVSDNAFAAPGGAALVYPACRWRRWRLA